MKSLLLALCAYVAARLLYATRFNEALDAGPERDNTDTLFT